ncbi:hypothetical protein [Bacillus paramycoides]|uniref:hypothetical protein n=1 Tax=Bacillus paramycoides TaxID=2026194 RepID=UPI003D23B125
MNQRLNQLKDKFESNGIDYTKIGFHLDDAFLLAEQKGIITLEDYAEFLIIQSYSDDYIEYAKEKVKKISEYIANLVIGENKYGQCAEVSLSLTNLLDELGIWNFGVKGSLTISSEDEKFDPQHFYDMTFNNNVSAPHAWVYVPTVGIIDLTLQKQYYASKKVSSYLPKYNLIKESDFSYIRANEDDVVDPVIQVHPIYKHNGREKIQKVRQFNKKFKAINLISNNISFRYIPIAIGLPDAGFDENSNKRKINEKTLKVIYDEVKEL